MVRHERFLFAGETVADALLGEQVAGLGGVGFDFAPQAGHEDAQVLGVFSLLRAPNFGEKKLVREDFSDVPYERG